MTAMFLVVIMGATHGRAPVGFAPLAIGLALTLIHLISIPVTNTSVNPARSTAVGMFAGSGALGQLWMFWVAPIIGGVIGGAIYRWLGAERPDIEGEPSSIADGVRPDTCPDGAEIVRGQRTALRAPAANGAGWRRARGRACWHGDC